MGRMGFVKAFEEFVACVSRAASPADLGEAVANMANRLGCDYFALTHHADPLASPGTTIRLHNYPERWVDYFDRHGLAACDPIHRASQQTALGFAWRSVPEMIPLTPADHHILALAADHGIGEGFTMPAHVPGEITGSCSFVTSYGRPLLRRHLPLAQLAGAVAFEGARRVWQVRPLPVRKARLTDRQRDCLIWAARGKGDWEAGIILGISEETVAQHVSAACKRYGVRKRTSLIILALFDGTISFADIARR
ncbi:MAG TPA: LuxR family transcriptional regulator [Sphingomonas sp.]|jgi:LuxR family quorum-sensing system transcriptional regulator CciR|nr:LuxR family transcriptional regulator [Sphingomonas sp.]